MQERKQTSTITDLHLILPSLVFYLRENTAVLLKKRPNRVPMFIHLSRSITNNRRMFLSRTHATNIRFSRACSHVLETSRQTFEREGADPFFRKRDYSNRLLLDNVKIAAAIRFRKNPTRSEPRLCNCSSYLARTILDPMKNSSRMRFAKKTEHVLRFQ